MTVTTRWTGARKSQLSPSVSHPTDAQRTVISFLFTWGDVLCRKRHGMGHLQKQAEDASSGCWVPCDEAIVSTVFVRVAVRVHLWHL